MVCQGRSTAPIVICIFWQIHTSTIITWHFTIYHQCSVIYKHIWLYFYIIPSYISQFKLIFIPYRNSSSTPENMKHQIASHVFYFFCLISSLYFARIYFAQLESSWVTFIKRNFFINASHCVDPKNVKEMRVDAKTNRRQNNFFCGCVPIKWYIEYVCQSFGRVTL